MTDLEISNFVGGLVLKPTADELKLNQLQEAEEVEFNREVGAVLVRKGIDKYYSRALSADEIFWQRSLDTEGLITRAGNRLYDGLRPVFDRLTDAVAHFTEFGSHVVLANGYETMKYKQSGMTLTMHTCYMFDFERDIIDANEDINWKATVQGFLYAYGDPLGEGDAEWRVTHEWERNYIEGDTLDENSDDFYTSSNYADKRIGTTFVSSQDICRAVNLGVPEGGIIDANAGSGTASDSPIKLLLHCEGSDGSTTFNDNSFGAHVVTAGGDAEIDVAQYKFGSSSALFDGLGDYLSIPNHTDHIMGTSTFGIDFWMRFNGLPSKTNAWDAAYLFGQGQVEGTEDRITLRYSNYVESLIFQISIGGTSTVSLSTSWSPQTGRWYHIYVCRGWGNNSNKWALCIDGSAVDTTTSSNSWPDFGTATYIGGMYTCTSFHWEGFTLVCDGYDYLSLDGWLDEFRIVKGEAPWTANFTPPTAAYEDPTGAITGDYSYRLSYLNYDRREGNPGPTTDVTTSSEEIQLTLPVSEDPQVVARRIYRTEDSGTTYKLLTTIENNYDTTYTDSTADEDLGDAAPTDKDEPPIFSEVHSHKGLLWGVEAANKNKIWWCEAFDEWDSFPSTNYEYFGSQSDETKALVSLAEFLIIVQDARVWRFDADANPEVKNESFSKIGVPTGYAALQLGDAILLVDAAGMYYFDAIKDLKFSYRLDPLFDGESSYSERINTSYLSNLRTGFLDDRLYVSYTRTGQTANDRTLVYNRKFQNFQGIIQKGFTCFTTDKKQKRLFGVGTDGYIYQLETGSDDDGSSIAWSFKTKDLSSDLIGGKIQVSNSGLSQSSADKLIWKQAGKIRVDINPGGSNLTVAVFMDGTSRQTRTYDDSSRVVKEFRAAPDYSFVRMAVKFSGVTGDQAVYGVRFIGTEIIGEGE